MILITGGTGNLGPHLMAALLARGEAVRVLTRSEDSPLPMTSNAWSEIFALRMTSPKLLTAAATLWRWHMACSVGEARGRTRWTGPPTSR